MDGLGVGLGSFFGLLRGCFGGQPHPSQLFGGVLQLFLESIGQEGPRPFVVRFECVDREDFFQGADAGQRVTSN